MKTTSYLHSDALAVRTNRNKAFAAGLDYLQQNHIPGKLNDRLYRLYWNINLYVDTSTYCNCFCSFCINCAAYERIDTTDEVFVHNLELAIRETRHLDPSIQLVGGEPTLKKHRKRLEAAFDLIKKYKVRKPVLGTNGTGLMEDDFVAQLDQRMSHVNISRHHYDEDKLNIIWDSKNPLPTERLRDVLATPLGEKIRLNCVLLKGNIDSYDEIVTFIRWAVSMNVRNVSFSTLSILPEGYIYSDAYINTTEEYAVPFNHIMSCIDQDKRFTFQKFHTGSHCMYEIWKFEEGGKSCAIVFATSNNTFAQRLDEASDLIELLVFHTDGRLTGSWNRDIKPILSPVVPHTNRLALPLLALGNGDSHGCGDDHHHGHDHDHGHDHEHGTVGVAEVAVH